jgi:hypothetical protein
MIVGATLFFPPDWPKRNAAVPDLRPHKLPAWGKILIGTYISVQILLPLRAWWTPGYNAWTGDGFNFAWKVMIVEKRGFAAFIASDGKKTWSIDTCEHLTPRQCVMMAQDPYLIRDFAGYLADDLRKRGHPNIRIRADAYASLNGRPSQRMIDPAHDLAGPLKPGWIIPLIEPPAPPRAAIPEVAHSSKR